jgi:hypothetical protein
MTSPNHRIAQPGDIFILLVPSAQELHLLRQWQTELQARFGGQMVNHLHITSQRFTPRDGQLEGSCIQPIKDALGTIKSFPVFSDMLIQFCALYWGTHVLRWRVQETDAYKDFRTILDLTLSRVNCPSHFDRLRHASCTALNLAEKVDLEGNPPGRKFPALLFTARALLVSQLVGGNEFNIIESITLS